MKYCIVVAFVFAAVFYCSCSSGHKYLTTYYSKHTEWHQQLRDSLTAFCTKYKTRQLYLKKISLNNSITLKINIPGAVGVHLITFDENMNRVDAEPQLTQNIDVPSGILTQFQNSIYRAISLMGDDTFFAYKQDRSMLFARETSDVGIVITNDKYAGRYNEKEKLGKNTFISSRFVQ